MADRSTYIQDVPLSNEEVVEIHRCPHCEAPMGVDYTYLDQRGTDVVCPMCRKNFEAADPINEREMP